jgi:RNA polymerase sigma-70 factor (ECF subfamily)
VTGAPDDWDWNAAISHCRKQARALLGSCPEADDAAQEALLRAWRARLSCRNAAARNAWLAQITRREVFRLVTREADTRRDAILGEAPDRSSTIDERLEAVEDRADLVRALDGLSGVDRRLVSLRYQHDMTYKSAAEALGMPEGTAKVRLHRIHKKLSSALQTTAGEW